MEKDFTFTLTFTNSQWRRLVSASRFNSEVREILLEVSAENLK